ncbi:MAG TPA: hypothetical protein VGT02_03980 [Methylomirabilota bacterium]|jgi:hypothetical protein|nr:hypothetical protein [Methylomirabilota bacterium]
MSEIKRMGPPAARDVRGKAFTWTIPLNQMPDQLWKRYFSETKDTSIVCSPWKVSIYQGQMIFESEETDLVNWVKFIDKWMGVANKRYTEWEAEQRRLRGADDKDRRDRDERLSEMNEKFKNL